MLKYVDTKVVFREVPYEITLAINISRCPCFCKGCHSSYLAEDIGEELNDNSLLQLISKNNGVTCIAFMGGDIEPSEVDRLAKLVHSQGLKTAWYSGRPQLSNEIDINNFNYIKIGPYKEECGPLDSKTTNQRFFSVNDGVLADITQLFWKDRI